MHADPDAPAKVPSLRPRTGRGFDVLVAAGLIALALYSYRGLFGNGFFEDDHLWVRIARDLAQSPSQLFAMQAENTEAVLRLTQRVLMAAVYAVAGTDPAPYHAVSLAVHVLVAFLVYRLLLEVQIAARGASHPADRWLAAAGAVWFATSSQHAMAVLWIAALSGPLATSAVLVLALFLTRRRHRWRERGTIGGAVLLFVLALFSKNTIAATPLALLAWAPLVRPDLGARRAVREMFPLASVLVVLAAIHLVVGKVLWPLWAGAERGSDFAVSTHFLPNLAAKLVAPLLAPSQAERWFGGTVPVEVLAMMVVGGVAVAARTLGVGRAAVAGGAWMLLLGLPVSFLDHRQFDPAQMTVNRYLYAPMVGAVLTAVFLTGAAIARVRHARVGAVVTCALLLVFVVHHDARIQARRVQLERWGEADQALIEGTRSQARQMLLRGTPLIAVGWSSDDAFVRSIGALYLEPFGYSLDGEVALDAAVRAFREGRAEEPWVAIADRERGELELVPWSRFRRLRAEGDDRLPPPPGGTS